MGERGREGREGEEMTSLEAKNAGQKKRGEQLLFFFFPPSALMPAYHGGECTVLWLEPQGTGGLTILARFLVLSSTFENGDVLWK